MFKILLLTIYLISFKKEYELFSLVRNLEMFINYYSEFYVISFM